MHLRILSINQSYIWPCYSPPPFLSDAPAAPSSSPNGAPSYGSAAAPIQVQSARYGPAYAATSAPMASTVPVYAQPQFTSTPGVVGVPYGGVQSSSANTNGPNGYAQPAFAVAPQYAQPQYVVAATNGIAPAAIYVPVQPLLAPSVMVTNHYHSPSSC